MTKKKNRFLTFICSLLPGAGHMYIGFMKNGVSFMAAFFFIIFLSSWLSIGQLLFIEPLIWFYSFFDCNNKASLDSDERSLVEDKYLFSINKLSKIDNKVFEKRSLAIGGVLLFLGVYLVIGNIIDVLRPYINYNLYLIMHDLIRQVPQIIIGILIVALGIRLIQGKKRESRADA